MQALQGARCVCADTTRSILQLTAQGIHHEARTLGQICKDRGSEVNKFCAHIL